jgi:hypothetical protein
LADITKAGLYTVTVQRHTVNGNDADHKLFCTNPISFKIDNPHDKLSGDYLESLPDGYHYANGIGVPLSTN